MSRDAKQKQLIEQWEKKSFRGTIIAPPGLGKTRMAIEYVLNKSDNKLVVVHKIDLVRQWKQRCPEAEVATVQSLIKNTNHKEYDVIVYDEIHKLVGPKYRKCFYIKSKKKLGLTGTADKDVRVALSSMDLGVVAECTNEEAISKGWISDYMEYNIPVYLDEKSSNYLAALQEEYDKKLRFISLDLPEWSVVEKILQKKIVGVERDSNGNELYHLRGKNKGKKKYIYKYENAEKVAAFRKQEVGVVIRAAIRIRQIIQERKKAIYNHPKKLEYVKKLFDFYKGKKIVTFSMENNFVDEVSKIDGVSLHGGVKPKKRQQEIIELFNNGDLMILNTCNKLNEGTDIKGLEIGINISYFGKVSVNRQRLGRVTRKEEGKKPIFINLYVKYHPKVSGYSQEELWLRRQQKDRENKVEWLSSIRDLFSENDNIN